jgi:hypothetical protein
MEHNINKEKWVNEAMQSTQGITRAAPAAGMAERAISKLNGTQATNTARVPLTQWAAAAVILLALNLGSVIHFAAGKNKAGQAGTINTFAAEVPAVSTYNY